jgi:transposase
MTDPAKLNPDDLARLTSIYSRSPALAALAEHVRGFAAMMRELGGTNLPQWIAKVMDDDLPSLHTFAKGLMHDLAAVTAGLTMA